MAHLNVMYDSYRQVYTIVFKFNPIIYVASGTPWYAAAAEYSTYPKAESSIQTALVNSLNVELSEKEMYASHFLSEKTQDEVLFDALREAINKSDYPNSAKSYMHSQLDGVVSMNVKTGGDHLVTPFSAPLSEKTYLSEKASKLPGVDAYVGPPCRCPFGQMELFYAIQHLNDKHRWSREKIADWLDDLADSGVVDLDFPVPDEVDFDRDAVNGTKETQ